MHTETDESGSFGSRKSVGGVDRAATPHPARFVAPGLRFLTGLPRFLRSTLTPESARRTVTDQRVRRGESFVEILRSGVYDRATSPYRNLLEHAGIGFEEASSWVAADGVETTLERFRAAGVYVTLEELKGRQPIERGDLVLEVAASDFDSPLLDGGYSAATSGTSGRPTRVIVDSGLLAHEAAHSLLVRESFGITARPTALWRPVLPAVAGLKHVLRHARHGEDIDAWFTPIPWTLRDGQWPFAVFGAAVIAVGRLCGRRLPVPRQVELSDAASCARWLTDARDRRGGPGVLETTPSAAVRVCLAAREENLDISGSVLHVGGEPLTPARQRVIEEVGCRTMPRYSLAEAGNLGIACARPEAVDDVHLLADKVAVLVGGEKVGGETVAGEAVDGEAVRRGSLAITSLLPSSPKLLLNVEIGDVATVTRRRCGCLFDGLGFDRHLHSIRSTEKLTTLGGSFLTGELLELVDEVLPHRFGGGPGDYQLVERESPEGVPRVELRVRPRLGPLPEDRLVDTVIGHLGERRDARGSMAGIWRRDGLIRVVRDEPLVNAGGKIAPLCSVDLTVDAEAAPAASRDGGSPS